MLWLHCIVEELKLELNGVEPMVCFQRLTRFNESRWLGGQKLHIRASCLVSSITDIGAFMVGVGYEVTQQLDLLNPRLMDGCKELSQGRRRQLVPIRLHGLGIHTFATSAHHDVMQMIYH
jgi:hypothetical protein